MDCDKLLRCCVVLVVVTMITATNLQVEYYTTATLPCDNVALNISGNVAKHSSVRAKYWIIPSGAKIDNSSIPEIIKRQKEWEISDDWYNFSITINYIDDDDFGIYYCLIVREDFQINVVKQGLNIDGPYFGHLYAEYRENAIVGGIAAAVLLVLILGSCVVWHCRFSKKEQDDDDDIEELKSQSDNFKSYDNAIDVNTEDMDEKL